MILTEFCDFKMAVIIKVVSELCVVQFWSEIILVISNWTHTACLSDFKIMHMISDKITLHSVQLPLWHCMYTVGNIFIISLIMVMQSLTLAFYTIKCKKVFFWGHNIFINNICDINTQQTYTATVCMSYFFNIFEPGIHKMSDIL